jgi:hypothetical protein
MREISSHRGIFRLPLREADGIAISPLPHSKTAMQSGLTLKSIDRPSPLNLRVKPPFRLRPCQYVK